MPPTPVTAATDEVGLLSGFSRSGLAALWVDALRQAVEQVGNSGRGRGGRWAAVGRDPAVRRIEREFARRVAEGDELTELWLRRLSSCGQLDHDS